MSDDKEKIEQLYRYRAAILGFMRRRGFSPEDARDLTQIVFVRVCQSVKDYRGEAEWGYLEKIARNVALNEIRDRHTKKREGIEVPDDEAVDLSDKHAVRADKALEAKEQSERLGRAIEQLDPTLRTTVLLYLSDVSYEDIARTLGISVSAVKSRLHATRQRLKEWIGEEPMGLGGE